MQKFVVQLRAAQMRGLNINAEDILQAGEWLAEVGGGLGLMADKVEEICRRRTRVEADRRFGQPHFGH